VCVIGNIQSQGIRHGGGWPDFVGGLVARNKVQSSSAPLLVENTEVFLARAGLGTVTSLYSERRRGAGPRGRQVTPVPQPRPAQPLACTRARRETQDLAVADPTRGPRRKDARRG